MGQDIRSSVDNIKDKRLLKKEKSKTNRLNRRVMQQAGESGMGIMEDGVNSLCPGWPLWNGSPEPEHPSCFEKL